jgi:hypothetical protein
MRNGASASVRRACAEFLAIASGSYEVPVCGIRVLSARPLRVRENWTSELFGDYDSEHKTDPSLDADGRAEGHHLFRHIPEHALPQDSRIPGIPAAFTSGRQRFTTMRVVRHRRSCSGCPCQTGGGGSIGNGQIRVAKLSSRKSNSRPTSEADSDGRTLRF